MSYCCPAVTAAVQYSVWWQQQKSHPCEIMRSDRLSPSAFLDTVSVYNTFVTNTLHLQHGTCLLYSTTTCTHTTHYFFMDVWPSTQYIKTYSFLVPEKQKHTTAMQQTCRTDKLKWLMQN